MHLSFHADPVPFNFFDVSIKGGRNGAPFLLEHGPLGRADIFNTHPRSDSARQAASPMAQKRTGRSGFRCGLTGGMGSSSRWRNSRSRKSIHTVLVMQQGSGQKRQVRRHNAVINGVSRLFPADVHRCGLWLSRAPGDDASTGGPMRSSIHAMSGPGRQLPCRTQRMTLFFRVRLLP
jgi:hypothetical protein